MCQCLSRQSSVPLSSHRRSRQMERRRKTNRMLITVTIIFFVSWAPLNLFNILIDTFEPFDNSESSSKMMLKIFAFCHLMAMTSVVTNPVMYGFLNENFKQSLISLLTGCCFQTPPSTRNVSRGSIFSSGSGAAVTLLFKGTSGRKQVSDSSLSGSHSKVEEVARDEQRHHHPPGQVHAGPGWWSG